jgi:hypothetical protein
VDREEIPGVVALLLQLPVALQHPGMDVRGASGGAVVTQGRRLRQTDTATMRDAGLHVRGQRRRVGGAGVAVHRAQERVVEDVVVFGAAVEPVQRLQVGGRQLHPELVHYLLKAARGHCAGLIAVEVLQVAA